MPSLLKEFNSAGESELIRATILRHYSASLVRLLVQGVGASLTATAARPRLALYLHYLVFRGRMDAGRLALIAASGMFDPAFYLKQNEDVAIAGSDPLLHFADFGAAEGRNPSSSFNTRFYLEEYPDVKEKGINPLLHFVTRGREEGRIAKPIRAPKTVLHDDLALPKPPPERVARDELRPLPKRVVIYTAVSGNYDELKPPAFRPPNCDFVVFTDQPLHAEGWEVRPFNYRSPDPVRAARFVKLHPHIYFPEYEHSIWIDANVGVHGDVRELFRRLKSDAFFGIVRASAPGLRLRRGPGMRQTQEGRRRGHQSPGRALSRTAGIPSTPACGKPECWCGNTTISGASS